MLLLHNLQGSCMLLLLMLHPLLHLMLMLQSSSSALLFNAGCGLCVFLLVSMELVLQAGCLSLAV